MESTGRLTTKDRARSWAKLGRVSSATTPEQRLELGRQKRHRNHFHLSDGQSGCRLRPRVPPGRAGMSPEDTPRGVGSGRDRSHRTHRRGAQRREGEAPLQPPIQGHLCFSRTDYRSEVPTTPSSGWIHLLERLTEFGKPVYLLDRGFIIRDIKGYE